MVCARLLKVVAEDTAPASLLLPRCCDWWHGPWWEDTELQLAACGDKLPGRRRERFQTAWL